MSSTPMIHEPEGTHHVRTLERSSGRFWPKMSSYSLGGPASGGVVYVRRLIGAFGALSGGLVLPVCVVRSASRERRSWYVPRRTTASRSRCGPRVQSCGDVPHPPSYPPTPRIQRVTCITRRARGGINVILSRTSLYS